MNFKIKQKLTPPSTQIIQEGKDPKQWSKTNPQVSSTQLFEETYPIIANSFKQIQKEQYELMSKKMLDYGIDNIAMGTKLETPEEIKFSLTSIFIRCHDKMSRLKNLVVLGKINNVKNESIRDTYMDLSNYNILAMIVSEGNWKK